MQRIDEFVNSMYEDLNVNDHDIEELKSEMKTHLIDTVKDLQKQGKYEDESIDIAIERFGDKKQLHTGLLEIFNYHAGPNSRYKKPDAHPAGFWAGFWHGYIVAITFIISMFNSNVRIYETNNRGRLYDIGYMLGLTLSFSPLGVHIIVIYWPMIVQWPLWILNFWSNFWSGLV
jgi:hypothetical protein